MGDKVQISSDSEVTSCDRKVVWPIYNLEFPFGCTQIDIDGYSFERLPNYAEQHQKLQFLVNCTGPEFRVNVQTGQHVHTANVICPIDVAPSVIPWGYSGQSALDDILLLLRLFTERDVFALVGPSGTVTEQFAILADPRIFRWGGVLACSIPYESNASEDPCDVVNTKFQVHLPKIYDRMKCKDWQRMYQRGFFLVLLNEALRQRTIETAFVQCWTIWEHLFACLTDSWMSASTIRQLSSKEKIAFLLVHFEVRVHLEEHEKTRLDDLVAIRNRLIHFGRFPERDAVHANAEMFIRMTEYIAAKALGLFPSNIFNTIELFEEFIAENTKKSK